MNIVKIYIWIIYYTGMNCKERWGILYTNNLRWTSVELLSRMNISLAFGPKAMGFRSPV